MMSGLCSDAAQCWQGLLQQAPLLPLRPISRLALLLSWSVVLGYLSAWLLRHRSAALRGMLVLTVLVWALMPGRYAPAYWLGLAFQTPSVTTVLLSVAGLIRLAGRGARAEFPSRVPQRAGLGLWSAAAIGAGWILLIDTLALWPVSVYAWGFTAAAVMALALCVWLELLRVWRAHAHWGSAAVLLGVLCVFVVLRLPSGNIWDAVLDPWLWLVLQGRWLLRVWRMRREAVLWKATTLS